MLVRRLGGQPARATSARTVAGFPNLFLLLGPNTGLGHSSMVYMIESQIAYVTDALRVMRERGAAVAEVRPEIAGRLQPRDRRADGAHRVEHGLLELVPGRDRPQLGAVAGLDVALPPPHAALRPGGARAAPGDAGARAGRRGLAHEADDEEDHAGHDLEQRGAAQRDARGRPRRLVAESGGRGLTAGEHARR